MKKFLKNNFKNLGLTFLLIIYYLETLINSKLFYFINFQKFYSKMKD
jgi:hypothetical protein